MSEDRQRDGSRHDRRAIPLGVRVRYGIAILVALIAAYAASRALDVSHRLAADEQRTCLIQKRGLPAGHALAAVVNDLYFFASRPLTARAINRLPARQRAQMIIVYHDLAVQAATYARLEREQPGNRSC